jgi:hypothetical protein
LFDGNGNVGAFPRTSQYVVGCPPLQKRTFTL